MTKIYLPIYTNTKTVGQANGHLPQHRKRNEYEQTNKIKYDF